MNASTRFLLLLLLFSCFYTQSQVLSSIQWKNRVLLLMSEDPNDPMVKQQISLFSQDSEQLKERKLVLLQVFPEFYLMGSDNGIRRPSDEVYFDYKSAKKSFELILIGLDGDEKLRRNEMIRPEDLYAIIDSMPMRRYEMK
ncbi:MAG: DUF4174 domain-containing protein [Lutimonas sp.]